SIPSDLRSASSAARSESSTRSGLRAPCRTCGRFAPTVPTLAPYGSWSSPITLDLVASEGGVGFSYVAVDEEGVHWLEGRPEEKGRMALVHLAHGGSPADVVPAGFNVRTRVHEYGGGAWFRDGRSEERRVGRGGGPRAVAERE